MIYHALKSNFETYRNKAWPLTWHTQALLGILHAQANIHSVVAVVDPHTAGDPTQHTGIHAQLAGNRPRWHVRDLALSDQALGQLCGSCREAKPQQSPNQRTRNLHRPPLTTHLSWLHSKITTTRTRDSQRTIHDTTKQPSHTGTAHTSLIASLGGGQSTTSTHATLLLSPHCPDPTHPPEASRYRVATRTAYMPSPPLRRLPSRPTPLPGSASTTATAP